MFELGGETEKALTYLGEPRSTAGRMLQWAVFNLRAARIGERIVKELSAGNDGYQQLFAVFPEPWDVLEVAAMSLAFEDVTTALDLCANAVYVAAGGTPSLSGEFKDLRYWTPARVASLPSASRKWVGDLLADPNTATLRLCREGLAHRLVTRHIRMGGGVDRSLAEIATLATPGGTPSVTLGSILDLIPQLVRFGEGQYETCCRTLQADFGR